jgi:hypothetical protein
MQRVGKSHSRSRAVSLQLPSNSSYVSTVGYNKAEVPGNRKFHTNPTKKAVNILLYSSKDELEKSALHPV